jgi:hypothetical protein
MARGLSSSQRTRIRALLEANQGGWFGAACKRLRKRDLRQRLKLPEAPVAPAPPAPLAPIEDHSPLALHDALPAVALPSAVAKAGRIGFRVVQRRTGTFALKWGFFYSLAALVGEFVITFMQPDERPPPGSWVIFLPALPAMVLGALKGHATRDDRCADCDAHLPVEASNCSECGAVLQGTLADRAQRLAAHEAVEGVPPDPAE